MKADQETPSHVDEDNTLVPTDRTDPAAKVPAKRNTEHRLRLAQAIEGAAIEDAAEVYAAFAKQAKSGASWRASDAFLERFLAPILAEERKTQAGADLPGAVEDGSLAELLTGLAERIAQRGGLGVIEGEPEGEPAQDPAGQRAQVGQDGAQNVTFTDRLDEIRVGLVRRRLQGPAPGPRPGPRATNNEPPPTQATPARQGERAREAMEPPYGRQAQKLGGNEVIEAEFADSSGDTGAKLAMRRDRELGGSDE